MNFSKTLLHRSSSTPATSSPTLLGPSRPFAPLPAIAPSSTHASPHYDFAQIPIFAQTKRADSTNEMSTGENTAQRIRGAAGHGHPLAPVAQQALETSLKVDLSPVRIHTDNEADALSRSLDAEAFTTGADIFFRSGAYNPSSIQGIHLLAHEATHVVQQAMGPVAGTPTGAGLSISDPSDSFEQAAEQTAALVTARGQQSKHPTAQQHTIHPLFSPSNGRVQRRLYTQPAMQHGIVMVQRARKQEKSKTKDKKGVSAAKNAFKKSSAEMRKERKKLEDIALTVVKKAEIDTGDKKGTKGLPDSQYKLYNVVGKEIEVYKTWLDDDDTWSSRVATMQQKRAEAQKAIKDIESYYDTVKKAYPKSLGTRIENRDYEKNEGRNISKAIGTIREKLAQIDEFVTETPPPPKTWTEFMGYKDDDDEPFLDDYHTGAQNDPIPVVWYKSEANYEDIVISAKYDNTGKYTYPNGPKVEGRLKTYDIKVDPKYQIGAAKAKTFKNTKKQETRERQVDINYALKQNGVNMNGKDGDHVTDLGFGGIDSDKNYWPLKAEVNRRPFHGWRTQYGVNYIDSKGEGKTATITALEGKWLTIKSFMASNEGNVPAEGTKPEEKSGTEEV